jgi:hypothetical protein
MTDVASQARWIFLLLNAHGPSAELSLATWPGRVLYARGGSPLPGGGAGGWHGVLGGWAGGCDGWLKAS